tara:strand:+ start:454 stop:789 length:336 start_codon:yes stop_codon:yes gene_type:complete
VANCYKISGENKLKTYLKNHSDAQINPIGVEISLVHCVNFVRSYVNEYILRYGPDQKLSDDYVLGPVYLSMVQSSLRLLDGELGRLDGGMLDIALRASARVAGFTSEEIEG